MDKRSVVVFVLLSAFILVTERFSRALKIIPPDSQDIRKELAKRKIFPFASAGNNSVTTSDNIGNFWAGGEWNTPIKVYSPKEGADEPCEALLDATNKSVLSIRADNTRTIVEESCKIPISKLDAGYCLIVKQGSATYGRNRVGCLPSLIIFGYQKCATAELQAWLSAHPVLQRWEGDMPHKSGAGEANYFNIHGHSIKHASSTYKSAYILRGLLLPKVSDAISKYTFEKSPNYGAMSQTNFATMRALLPSVKLIGLVRNPVARAYSGFQHSCYKGRVFQIAENIPLTSKNLERKQLRHQLAGRIVVAENVSQVIENLRNRYGMYVVYEEYVTKMVYPCTPESFTNLLQLDNSNKFDIGEPFSKKHLASMLDLRGDKSEQNVSSILTHGHYASEIERVLASFPSKQIGIIITEDFFKHTKDVLDMVQRFLGVPRFDYTSFTEHNDRGHIIPSFMGSKSQASAYLPLSTDVQEHLKDYYKPHNAALAEMFRDGRVVVLTTNVSGWWF